MAKEESPRIMPDDWHGNNAAFLCPFCNRAFIVSKFVDNKDPKAKNKDAERFCPRCTGAIKCVGFIPADKAGRAYAYLTTTKGE